MKTSSYAGNQWVPYENLRFKLGKGASTDHAKQSPTQIKILAKSKKSELLPMGVGEVTVGESIYTSNGVS